MSLKETINNDIKQAMLAKKKAELTALRGIKSMILLAETEKGAAGELSSDAEMKLLMKAAKQRKESAELYSNEGRTDLADKELLELLEPEIPKDIPYVFISSATQQGLVELKDLLWKVMNE